jgi:hypothetical protein
MTRNRNELFNHEISYLFNNAKRVSAQSHNQAAKASQDLGQETLIALSKVDPGRGLVAGICVAFIAITADRLITAWANKRKQELGLS